MKKIRILIVDDISDTRESIRRLLQFEPDIEVIGEAGSGSEALLMAEDLSPDIVLMDINMPEMDGIRTTELLALRAPESSVIIMSVQGESAYLRRAMMAGAREYIVKPFTGDELASAIANVHELERRKQGVSVEPSPYNAGLPQTRKGQIISFFSTKGGVGKTTLATNLAVELAHSRKWRVLLIDLNLQFGDVGVFLNLVPKRNVADLTQTGNLQFSEIQSFLLTHPSGVQILAAPTRPEYAELVTVEHIEQILKEVKPHFDFILIDNVSRFEDLSLLSLDLSERIFLVVTMEVPALKNTKLSLETMSDLHYLDKVQVILNCSSRDMGLDLSDIEKSLNFQVSYEIPSDGKTLVNAVNKGIPFVEHNPQSKAAEGIRKVAEAFLSEKSEASSVTATSTTTAHVSKSSKQLRGFRRVFGF